jgi:TFIIF-interacting CTD phosphatase-like protein
MKRYNIILDLDQTLISSELKYTFDFEKLGSKMNYFDYKNFDDQYIVFARPHLQTFLDFLFENFNVSVWTAASKSYALFVIDKFILRNTSRTLDFIFFSYHCTISKRVANELKYLPILWGVFGLSRYSKMDTVLIDDNYDVVKNQKCNCFHIKPFLFLQKDSQNDDSLLDLIKRLKNMNKHSVLECPVDFMT